MAALFGGLRNAAADAQSLCVPSEGSRCALASADRQRDRQSSRLCRGRAGGTRVLHRDVADRRRYPDEFCCRDGEGFQEARTLSEPERLADAHARAPGIPALDREGRGLPLCTIAFTCLRTRLLQPLPPVAIWVPA